MPAKQRKTTAKTAVGKTPQGPSAVQEPSRRPKTAKKTAQPTLVAREDGRGALLSGGVPGNAGGTGRPPNWLRDLCDELLAREESKKQVREVLADKDHPAYAAMWRAVSDRAKGKPTQSVELTGAGGGPVTVTNTWFFGGREIQFK